jgi:hypothetical protein
MWHPTSPIQLDDLLIIFEVALPSSQATLYNPVHPPKQQKNIHDRNFSSIGINGFGLNMGHFGT